MRDEFSDFIKHVESCIRYGGTSLERIYCSYSSPLLDKYGFTMGLRNGYTKDLVKNTLFLLSESEQAKADEFLKSLGKSRYREKETELCSYFCNMFEDMAKKLLKEDETKILLYKKLGLIAALMTAVIFI